MEDSDNKLEKMMTGPANEIPLHEKIQKYTSTSERRQAKFITDLRNKHRLPPELTMGEGLYYDKAIKLKHRLLSMSSAINGTANSMANGFAYARPKARLSLEHLIDSTSRSENKIFNSGFLSVPNKPISILLTKPLKKRLSDLSEDSDSSMQQGQEKDFSVEILPVQDTDGPSPTIKNTSVANSSCMGDWRSIRTPSVKSISVKISRNANDTSMRTCKMDVRLSALGYTHTRNRLTNDSRSTSKSRVQLNLSNVVVSKSTKVTDNMLIRITGKKLSNGQIMYEKIVRYVYMRDISRLKNVCKQLREPTNHPASRFFNTNKDEKHHSVQTLNKKDSLGLTPLGLAAILYTNESAIEEDIVKLLLDEGASAIGKNAIGNDPFHSAVLNVYDI